MKKSLIYTLPVLLTTACITPTAKTKSIKPTNITKINCLHSGEEKVQPYYEYLSADTETGKVIGFCNLKEELQQQIWDKIQEAEESGLPPTGVIPGSFYNLGKDQLKISVSRSEAYDIYAAHLARALWLDNNKIVPWKLGDYNDEQLADLLQPKAWFNSWDDKNEKYSFEYVLDNSPKESFQIASEAVPVFSDQKTALIDIIKSVRSFRHGSHDIAGKTSDPQEIVTIPTMAQEKISRYGCQTMSPYVVQLGLALNIPGETIRGYYDGENHRSALFEFTDQVLAHGDDVYGGNTPSSELMDSYSFWKEQVLPYPKHDPTAAHNSMIHNYKNYLKYPEYWMLWGYCKNGGMDLLTKVFMEGNYGPFATAEELKDVEKRILTISKNCTEFPKDKPDQ